MKHLNTILLERLNLDNTQKAIIASMAIAPSAEMAYAVLTGARNAVSAREGMERAGLLVVNDSAKSAQLTKRGEDVLTAENLTDEGGELTDRGEELVNTFRNDKDEWKKFESIKNLF